MLSFCWVFAYLTPPMLPLVFCQLPCLLAFVFCHMSCCLAAPSLILPCAFMFKVYRSCCCGKIMARAPDNIKSINRSKETLKLAVRIIDLWFVGTPNRSEQAEMVIIDSHVWFSLFLMYGFLCLFVWFIINH